MSSVCISRCVNDTAVPSRVRATYVNLHRWPESDAEFVRSLSFQSTSSAGSDHHHHRHHRYPSLSSTTGCGPKVVDSISCRQVYLRSYTFTRKESVNERAIKCIGKVKDKVVNGRSKKKKKKEKTGFIRASEMGRKVKEVPCAALKFLFNKLLFCSASVDVVDVND